MYLYNHWLKLQWKGIFTTTMSTLLVDIHTVADVFLFDLGRFSFWYAVGAIPEDVVYITKKCRENKWFEKPFKTSMRLFDFFENHLFLVLLDYFKCNAKLNSAIRSRSKVNAKSTTCWLKKPLRADTNSKALSAFQNRLYFFARANY